MKSHTKHKEEYLRVVDEMAYILDDLYNGRVNRGNIVDGVNGIALRYLDKYFGHGSNMEMLDDILLKIKSLE